MSNKFLTFSRQTRAQSVSLTLTPIIKVALKLLRSTLPTTIEIKERLQTETGSVLAEPTQIHQVLMNLCTNAAHAMRETGGVLTVSLSETEIGSDDKDRHPGLLSGKYVKLRVGDTGHGIDPSVRERIFEPFFTTKDRSEGTGMGLSVEHGIAKSHGGTVEVATELGRGTTFHVFFPKKEAGTPVQPEPTFPLPPGHEHVLLVDGEKSMVDAVEAMLKFLGYRVTARTDSMEALEVFRTRADDSDIVITDMTMPQM